MNLLKTLIKNKLTTLSSCYKKFIQQGLHIKGKITVKLTLDKKGRVILVKGIKNELNEAIGRCIKDQIEKWHFKGLNINKSIIVKITFFISL
jgi:outer membrane biosynthesis protein TonB